MESPYDMTAHFQYPYPPFFAVCLVPLSFVPVVIASALWSVLLAGALLYTFFRMRAVVPGVRSVRAG